MSPMDHKDYRMEVRIKNNRIMELIELAGFRSVLAFCTAHGFSPSVIGTLVNMQLSPLTQKGDWRAPVAEMAKALKVHPDMLFTEGQKNIALKTNKAEVRFQEEQLAQLVSHTPESLMLTDQAASALSAGLMKLTDKERDVLRLTYGLHGGKEWTLERVGNKYNISRERIRQIQLKAIRKLRNPTTLDRETVAELF